MRVEFLASGNVVVDAKVVVVAKHDGIEITTIVRCRLSAQECSGPFSNLVVVIPAQLWGKCRIRLYLLAVRRHARQHRNLAVRDRHDVGEIRVCHALPLRTIRWVSS